MSLSSSAPWLKYYGNVPQHLSYPQKTIYQMVRDAAIRDARLPAYEFMGKKTTFAQFMEKIDQTAQAFLAMGIQKGDRIALCGRNCANWAVAFLATLSYGAVAVPILHEFKPEQVHGIVNHSEARLLFVGDQVWPSLNADEMPHLEGIIINL